MRLSTRRASALLGCLALLLANMWAPVTARDVHAAELPVPSEGTAPPGAVAYPRPERDNGWGVHWAPTTFSQPAEIVDYFVEQLVRLDIRWVKLLLPASQRETAHEYLLRRLREEGIMPVARLYPVRNEPLPHLEEIVRRYVPLGVYYYQVYTDVNLRGAPGGWAEGEEISVGRVVDLWLGAARQVRAAGGLPGLPTLTAGGDYDDLQFLRDMLAEIERRGHADALQGAWLPVHNAFLNHPPEYPYDEVNVHGAHVSAGEVARWQLAPAEVAELNAARDHGHAAQVARGYSGQELIDGDSNAFLKFEAYRRACLQALGYEIPIISVAGGAVVGDRQDPRYPAVTEQDVAEWTLQAYNYMLDSAPERYLAFLPWLLVNGAAGGLSPHHERAAWYRDLQGGTQPVVAALRDNPRRGEVRRVAGAGDLPAAVGSRAAKAPSAFPPSGIVLLNGGFEGRYATRGAPEVLVAEGWQPWWREGDGGERSAGLYHRPEFAPERAADGGGRVRSGVLAQKQFTTYATHKAGLYQQVSVAPGSRVQFTAWVYVWSSSDDDPGRSGRPGAYDVSVGIDPFGGTDPTSARVVWSPSERRYDRWLPLTVTATAEEGRITVFTRGAPQWRVKHNDSYWDDATLRVLPPAGGASLPSAAQGRSGHVAVRGARGEGGLHAGDATAPPAAGTQPYALYATANVSLKWHRQEQSVTVVVRSAEALDAELRLWHDGQPLAGWQIRLRPGEVASFTSAHSDVGTGTLGVQLVGRDGAVLARFGAVGGDNER